jgi:hypothetical protein
MKDPGEVIFMSRRATPAASGDSRRFTISEAENTLEGSSSSSVGYRESHVIVVNKTRS